MAIKHHSIPMSATMTESFSSDSSSEEDDPSLQLTFEDTPFLKTADIYGQVHPIESKGLLQQRLTEFDDQLRSSKRDGKKSAFHEAMDRCPSLCSQESFRLMFLRAECFRVKDAVQRFARYWERRIAVFGAEKAFLPITLDSLDDDSRVFLNRGAIRWIRRAKDRDILFFDPSQLDPKAYDRKSAVQAVWFILENLVETDIRVQRKGVICIGYPKYFSSNNRDPGFTKQCLKFVQSALPLRITAGHCSSIPVLYYFVYHLIMCFVDERLKKRLLLHSDVPEQQLAERLERVYGIESSAIPTELGGQLDLASSGWIVDSVVKDEVPVVFNHQLPSSPPPKVPIKVCTKSPRERKQRRLKLWNHRK